MNETCLCLFLTLVSSTFELEKTSVRLYRECNKYKISRVHNQSSQSGTKHLGCKHATKEQKYLQSRIWTLYENHASFNPVPKTLSLNKKSVRILFYQQHKQFSK